MSILDESNRKIISLLEENPNLTQSEIARELDISQSAVAMRVNKLVKSGLFVRGGVLNITALGLQMGRADLATEDYSKVLEWASKCPLFINGSLSVGGRNVSLFFVSEDLEMFHHIVDDHLRKMKEVSDLSFSQIVNWIQDYNANLNLDFDRVSSPPCGQYPFCPKCPGNPNYNGRVWNYENPSPRHKLVKGEIKPEKQAKRRRVAIEVASATKRVYAPGAY